MRTFNFLRRTIVVFGMVMMFAVTGWSAQFAIFNPVSVLEGNNVYMDFNVTLTAISASDKCANNQDYSVTFETTTGGTSQEDDFTSISNHVISYHSLSNQTSGICYSELVHVLIHNDTAVEDYETVAAKIVNPTNATIMTGRDSSAGIIIDDDDVLTISVNDASIAEKNTTVKVNVLLTKPAPVGGISISYWTLPSSPSSAVSPADYNGTATPLPITIPAGATSYTIEIPINDDSLMEGTETFQIKINTTSATVITKDTAKITIFDNDSVSGVCSSYVGLITINEYQNNPHYFDIDNNKIKGNYIELKYIDALVKQHVNDDWNLALYSTQTVVKPWNSRDLLCTDPDYEVFQLAQGTESNAMGAKAIVVLTDQNGNEVDLFNLNNADTYTQKCHSFAYDTNLTDQIAADKEFFRNPDGTGDWSSLGLGSNSAGSRCLNIPGSGFELIYKQFEAIDVDELVPTVVTGAADVPLKTKITNKPFAVNILSLDTTTTGSIGQLKDINATLKVYLANASGGSLLDPTGHLVTFNNQSFVPLSNLTFPKAVKTVKLWFEYCQDASGALHNWDTCFQTVNVAWQRHAYSRNTFSVRPDKFDVNIATTNPLTIFKAGKEENLLFRAPDYTDNGSTDYNETQNTSFYIDLNVSNSSACQIKNLTVTPNVSFIDGIHQDNFSFNDIGDINMSIHETDGSEFAIIDNDDTPLDVRLITEHNASFRVIPDHFKIEASLANHNSDNNLTYLHDMHSFDSDDNYSMGAVLEANITAMHFNDINITHNYTDTCYAKDTNLTLALNGTTITYPGSTAPLTHFLYYNPVQDDGITPDAGEGKNSLMPVSSGMSISSLTIENNTSSFPADAPDGNGTTHVEYKLNFDRKQNLAVNPFKMALSDVNITDTDNVVGGDNVDQNATLYYARARPSQFLYDDVTASGIQTPIAIDIYCDLGFTACANFGINTVEGQTNEYEWWLSWDHNESNGDGNITLVTPNIGAATVDTDVTITSEGKDNSIDVQYLSGAKPMMVEINLDETSSTGTNHWLTYNPNSAIGTPAPFYKVRFIGQSGWAGHGDTGHVVDSNVSTKKNRRLGW